MPSRCWTLTDWLRTRTHFIVEPIASLLSRTGIHPNVLSVAGLVIAFSSAVVISAGHLFLGGWLFLLSGPFDALDGALARKTGLVSRFGAFLDSCLDRYAEAGVLFAIAFWSASHGCHKLVLLSFLAMVGSLMVSYARARAEGLGVSCKAGLFTRVERFFVTTIMLLTNQVGIGLALLACLANLTALQRMLHVFKALKRQ